MATRLLTFATTAPARPYFYFGPISLYISVLGSPFRRGLRNYCYGNCGAALPDFGTMWNWRREGYETLWATLEPPAMQKSCEQELGFLNGCLEVNPKS